MSNDTWIAQWKVGKYKIEMNKLDNEDKIKMAKIENLLNDLINYYEDAKKLMVRFDEGRFRKDEEKKDM